MSTKVKVTRDFIGQPTYIEINDRGKNTKISYQNDKVDIKGVFDSKTLALLGMFFPHSEKIRQFYADGYFVAADADTTAGLADVYTILYTVPPKKLLYILGTMLCTIPSGGASPYADIHVYVPNTGDTIEFINHAWNVVGGLDALSNVAGEVQVGFSAGMQVRILTGVQTETSGGFIGVIKDA
jgi:hypothetical protein